MPHWEGTPLCPVKSRVNSLVVIVADDIADAVVVGVVADADDVVHEVADAKVEADVVADSDVYADVVVDAEVVEGCRRKRLCRDVANG